MSGVWVRMSESDTRARVRSIYMVTNKSMTSIQSTFRIVRAQLCVKCGPNKKELAAQVAVRICSPDLR
jgi:hypothetical protein